MYTHGFKYLSFASILFFASSAYAADQVVTTNADAGAGSLRQAIADTVDGDSITFALTTGSEVIVISSELVTGSGKSLTIDGDNVTGSGTDVTVEVLSPGVSTYRVFTIDAGATKTVSLKNMTVRGGNLSTGYGGAIEMSVAGSSLSLENCTVRDSKAKNGAGLSVDNFTSVSITDSTFTANEAVTRGGAIRIVGAGTASITNSSIENNAIVTTLTSEVQYGAGVYFGTGTLTIDGSSLSNNTVSGATASVEGGGLDVNAASNVSITNSSFNNNDTGSLSHGAGIFLRNSNMSITNSTISGNSAYYAGAGIFYDETNSETGRSLTITNSTIANNSMTNSGSGGGIFQREGDLILTNTTFSGNTSVGPGGALYLTGGAAASTTITNSTIANNQSSSATADGIYHSYAGEVIIKNSILANNYSDPGDFDYVKTAGTVTDNGYNIVETSSGYSWVATGDIVGDQVNLNLSATLADNGSVNTSQTLALSSGSVAIDAGVSAANGSVAIPSTDQRGLLRDANPDIGAYEFGANIPPVAVDDTETTTTNTSIITANVLTNDSDADGDSLSVSAADTSSAQGGSVTNYNDGTFQYVPPLDYSGADDFDYTVSDGNGGTDIGTVNITIIANVAPVAVDDSETTTTNTSIVTANVLTNDTDADNDSLSVSTADAASVQGGSVTNNNDGTFEYVPPLNYDGPDSFNYTVSDGKGGTDVGTVNVTVDPAPKTKDDGFFGIGAFGLWYLLALPGMLVLRRRV